VPEPSVHLVSISCGGQASAPCVRSRLSVQAACAERGIGLQVDLGGGQALLARALGEVWVDRRARLVRAPRRDYVGTPEAESRDPR
jgi:hypothetical protein